MELTIASALLMALAGILVGILSAMFGIGGGIVMVPLLHIGFGLPAAASSGTSLFAILPTSISGMVARLHDGTIRFKVGIVVGIAGACMSPVGAWVSDVVPGVYAMVLTAVFIIFTAYKMFKRVYDSRPVATPAVQAQEPARHAPLAYGVTPAPRLYAGCVGLGMVVGFLSGYLGLGGGFLIVPILQWAFGFSMKQATGTSLVSVAILAIPAFVMHALLGHVHWVFGIIMILGALVGTRLGAAILRKVNDRLLTGLFGVVLVLSGIVMIVRELVG
ncbi:MAG: sulfite exporter TauE/SafE family protein [Coriobacteriales bacterium]